MRVIQAQRPRQQARRAALLVGLLVLAGVAGLLVVGRPGSPPTATAASSPTHSAQEARAAGTTAGPSATPARYDADGIPLAWQGEPVLRGTAIVARAARHDPAPFLVAGWVVSGPAASCAPSPIHCSYAPLVDAPEARADSTITLETVDHGTWSPPRGGLTWAGGFLVLRVRAACSWWHSTCLVVDDAIGPPGEIPADAAAYDADGVPTLVDGQPVFRGGAIAAQAGSAAAARMFYVAGWIAPARPDPSTCAEATNWSYGLCDVHELTDPARGIVAGSDAILVQGTTWTEESRSRWYSGDWWPGGFVVLRVRGRLDGGRAVLSVDAAIGPPGSSPRPTRVPTPTPPVRSTGFTNGRISDFDGEAVRWGGQISVWLARKPTAATLVTGVVAYRACATCPGGRRPILREPHPPGAGASRTEFPLLVAGGGWFRLRSEMIWRGGDHDGSVVMRVRPFHGTCPVAGGCRNGLLVETVVPARDN